MKKIKYLFLIFIFTILPMICVLAQEDETEEIPPGMEIIQIGTGAFAIVPKGTKVHRQDGIILLETTREFVARRFLDLDAHIAEIKAKQEELKNEVEKLKEALNKIQESKSPLPEEE